MKRVLPEPDFLTVPEAARLCGVSRNTVYSWVRKGKLDAFKTPGRTNLIRPSALVSFMHLNGMFVPPALNHLAEKDSRMDTVHGRDSSGKEREASVLVVEADPQSRLLAFRTFNGSCMVYEAETGYEALHVLTLHQDVSLVLLDLDVPGHYGPNTLTEMCRIRPGVGVIVARSAGRTFSSENAPKGLILEIIDKPFTLGTLKTAISQVRARLMSPARTTKTS